MCVRIVAWINGVLYGCAEDAIDGLNKNGLTAEAERGFRTGYGRWRK